MSKKKSNEELDSDGDFNLGINVGTDQTPDFGYEPDKNKWSGRLRSRKRKRVLIPSYTYNLRNRKKLRLSHESSEDSDPNFDPNDPFQKGMIPFEDGLLTSLKRVIDQTHEMVYDTIKDQLEKDRIKQIYSGLTDPEKENNKSTLELIEKKITKCLPKIVDVLSSKMPVDEKWMAMEKIIALRTFDHFTYADRIAYLVTGQNIKDQIKSYNNYDIQDDQLRKYTEIEKRLNKMSADMNPLKYRILEKLRIEPVPIKDQQAIWVVYKKLSNVDPMNDEFYKLKTWMDCVLALPYNIKTDIVLLPNSSNAVINRKLTMIKRSLKQKLSCMDNSIEQMISIITSVLTNPGMKELAIALVGPPGIGKTYLVKTFAELLKMPYAMISVAGIKDASDIHGHHCAFVGSGPGRIYMGIKRMKCINGLLCINELDKIDDGYSSNVSNSLLDVTDFTINSEYHDSYLGDEITINLSSTWFVYTLNSIDTLDKILGNRIPYIKIPDYTTNEKKIIANNNLIPDALREHEMNVNDVIFTSKSLDYLLEKSNRETGVRRLKQHIHIIIRKINVMRKCILDDGTYGDLNLSFLLEQFSLPITITPDIINKLNLGFESPILSYYT